MFEDLIDEPKDITPTKPTGGMSWDIDRYINNGAYCPTCGSKDVRKSSGFATSKKLFADKDCICGFCGVSWIEKFDQVGHLKEVACVK